MNRIKKLKQRTVGFWIPFVSLLSLIIFGSWATAENSNNNHGQSKPAGVANLEFVNIDLRQVFRYLAGAGGFQVILDPTVQGTVNIAFNTRIPAKDAVEALAASSGFSSRWLPDSTTLFIGNSKISDEILLKKNSRSMSVKYINSGALADSLAAVIPKAGITPDPGENRLTVLASELEYQNISEITRDLDRVLPRPAFDTRIVELPEPFLQELDRDSFAAPTRLGAHPLTRDRLKSMESHSQFISLLRREIIVSENEPGKLTLEDQIPKIMETSQENSVNYRIENLAVGMNLSVALRPGSGGIYTLWITEKVGTIANTNPPNNGAGYVPTLGLRELTSIIPWETGQIILLTGAFQRSEFNRLLNIPYKFPVLNDLFLGKQIVKPAQNTATQVLIIMVPQSGENAESPPNPGTDLSNSEFETIPGRTEAKETMKLNSSRIGRPSPTPAPVNRPVLPEEPIRIQYVVKKGDTLTRIAAKFGVAIPIIINENNLDSSGLIKIGTMLNIPIDPERIYTIKPKETLWRIAKRYGISLDELKDLNGIADIQKVNAGQKIVLPVPVTQIKNPQY